MVEKNFGINPLNPEHFIERQENLTDFEKSFKAKKLELTELWGALPPKRIIEIENRKNDFLSDLKMKFPNCNYYRAYHLLLGSSCPQNIDYLGDDFPGNLAEKFTDKLIAELKREVHKA